MLNGWIVLFRLLLGAVLAGAIGFEREYHGRAAGFRTHIILCVGSTLIMLTSMHMFDLYNGKMPVDPSRIAAGVITGIGFLGAGTIMHFKSAVRGLTTAASLWVAAGIGLSVGSGLYFGSIVATVLTLSALMVFSKLERGLIRKVWFKTLVLELKDGGMGLLKKIREEIKEFHAEITDFEIDHSAESNAVIFRIGLKLVQLKYHDQLIEQIGRLEGVKLVRWEIE